MKTIKGPAIFLAQFMGPDVPFDNLANLAGWAAGLGYKAIQLPCDRRLFDLDIAADSQDYCDEVAGVLAAHGLQVSELATHLQGQLVAVHPAYDTLFDGFADPQVRGNPQARTEWATAQLMSAARASRRLGLAAHVSFSGALAWPYMYPWPQRPRGLVEEAFAELGRRWLPILNAFEDAGVDLCYELHPGEDLHDGVSFERFLEVVGGHRRAISCTTPATSCCSSSTTWPSSISTTSASRPSTSRMPSFGRTAARACMAATAAGRTGQGASARWATARSTSARSSPKWRSTIFRDGPCWNGSAP
jgi:sugar phosphate isomerase/epimerase